MNDAEYEAQKERINKLASKWLPIMGLADWTMVEAWHRDSGEFTVDGSPSHDVTAATKVDWRYMWAEISWNLPRVAEQDDESLELIYVHELMHIMVDETRDLTGDHKLRDGREDWLAHEERVCTFLAKAFLRTSVPVEVTMS